MTAAEHDWRHDGTACGYSSYTCRRCGEGWMDGDPAPGACVPRVRCEKITPRQPDPRNHTTTTYDQ